MMSVEQNFGLANHGRFSRFGVIRGGARARRIEAIIETSDSAAEQPDPDGQPLRRQPAEGRDRPLAATGARVFLFDEPTRGIDVGAKAEIYALLRRLAAARRGGSRHLLGASRTVAARRTASASSRRPADSNRQSTAD